MQSASSFGAVSKLIWFDGLLTRAANVMKSEAVIVPSPMVGFVIATSLTFMDTILKYAKIML
jgi:hypothetical protein